MLRTSITSFALVLLVGVPALWMGLAFVAQVVFAFAITALLLTLVAALLSGPRKENN